MEDWQQEIIQEIVSRGLSPEGGLFRQKEKQIEEEENKRLKDLQQKLLQYQWFQQQGYDTEASERNKLEILQQMLPLVPYAKQGISLLSTLSKGVGLTPWGLPLLVGGFLFKKPLKKLFRKLRGR